MAGAPVGRSAMSLMSGAVCGRRLVQVDEVRALGRARDPGRRARRQRLDVVVEAGHDAHEVDGAVSGVGVERRAEQLEVALPVPVGARVPVHPRDVGRRDARDLVVAEDVLHVERDVVLACEVLHEARRRAIHRLAEPLGAGRREALVLETDRVAVDVPVARVPADVLRLEVLRDVPVRRAEGVLPRQVRRVRDELEGRLVARLGVVDDDVGDLRARPAGWRGRGCRSRRGRGRASRREPGSTRSRGRAGSRLGPLLAFFSRPRRASWALSGLTCAGSSDTSLPSTVWREAPAAITANVSSAKAAATSSCAEPDDSATAAYQAPGAVEAPTGRPRERCSAASRAAPPRMLASSSVRSASSSSPVRVAARDSVSATGAAAGAAGAPSPLASAGEPRPASTRCIGP